MRITTTLFSALVFGLNHIKHLPESIPTLDKMPQPTTPPHSEESGALSEQTIEQTTITISENVSFTENVQLTAHNVFIQTR